MSIMKEKIYNNDSSYDDVENDFTKSQINENIKYFIVKHVNFENVTQIYQVKININENFNDDEYTRHDMILVSCNIC